MNSESESLKGRLTIRLEVLPGDSVLARVELAARCGFDGIAFPGRFRDRFAKKTLEVLADLPIPIKTVSLGFEGSLCSPIVSQRQRCRDSLLELFDFTAALGAQSVNMPPVLIDDNPERFPADAIAEQDELLIQQLPLLGNEAAARNINLLIEPVNRSETDYLRTVGHAARICEAVNHPAIGLTPDFYHMQIEELDTADALRQAGKWIFHLHTAENTRVEPGPGELNFRPGFHALKEAGYQGLVEIECRRLSGPAAETLPRSAAYLRQEWAEA
jgi:sugar phosphate isomerase/epimerase